MLDKDLFELLGKDKKYIVFLTALNVLSTATSIAVSYVLCRILALAFQGEKDWKTYGIFFCIALGLAVLRFLLSVIIGKLKNRLGEKVKRKLRLEAYAKLLDLPLERKGEQLSSLTQMIIEGVEQVDTYYTAYLPSFFNAMLSPLLLFAVCLAFNWEVATVLILALPLIPLSIVLVAKWAKRIFAKYWDKYTSMGDFFLDSLEGLKDLKIFDADALQQKAIAEKSEDFRKVTMRVLVMQLYSLTIIDTVAFTAAGIAIVFAILGAQANPDSLNLANALFLILISAEFFLPMRALASAFHVAMNGSTAGKRIKAFLELPLEPWGTKEVASIDEVRLKDVTFSYDGSREVLKGIDLSFKKGINALVGESGCGKSTLLSLVLGTYLPTKGEVLLNEERLRDFDRASYYRHLCYVSYDTYLFNCSIRENFRLVKKDITDEEIYALLEEVNLRKFVEGLGGLDKLIEEGSENISGGERQRLALAIALSSEKDLYLFDECTSNIDIESEAIIVGKIEELAKKHIVILVSHRLENVVHADRIALLKDGVLLERGTHEELIRENGEYAALYQKQKALEEGYKEVSIHA